MLELESVVPQFLLLSSQFNINIEPDVSDWRKMTKKLSFITDFIPYSLTVHTWKL